MDSKPSILVIDDEPIVCESCHRILTKEDYQVDINTNPLEGFRQAVTNNYDLLLLDLMMDEMDGIELLHQLREKKPDLPVIIITGYPTRKSKEEADSLGVLHYILKPFIPNEILDPVTHIIEQSAPVQKEDLIELKRIISIPQWKEAENHFHFAGDSWFQKGTDNSVKAGGQFRAGEEMTIESITIPDVNNIIYRDLPLAEIILGNKTKLIIPSPISGKIIGVNNDLENDLPFIENNDYGKFWIARILPSEIAEDTNYSTIRKVLLFSNLPGSSNKYSDPLVSMGCLVRNASSISQVFELLGEDESGIMILDAASIPEKGPEYTRMIHKKFPELKIIVSDKPDSCLAKDYARARVYKYVAAPVHSRELSEILNEAFSSRTAGTESGKHDAGYLPDVMDRIQITNRYTKKETGVYFLFEPVNGNTNTVDLSEVSSWAREIHGIKTIWHSTDLPPVDTGLMAQKIRDKNLKRILIAGDSPGQVRNFFTRAMSQAGNDPDDTVLVSFRDYGAIYRSQTERAKAILFSVLYGISPDLALDPGENPVNHDTLIIGGGIAGIQSALEVANSWNKVYLVEKTATIGGHMATFDKTFPTLDCAACILTPKMVEVGQHPGIELMTCCEIMEVSGVPGDYNVKILKKARFVNVKTCTGCGICATKCPTLIPNEFDSGTSLRKAIYMPFPQAVPNKYVVDAANCRYMQDGKCGVCVKFCPVDGCINLEEKDEEVNLRIGNIILAVGFKPFDARRIKDYGYGRFPNVLTSLEFERLVNASGPTDGKVRFRKQDKRGNWIFSPDGDEPKSVALIHCVGSRDINYNPYCSRVCCMYSLKLAHLLREKLPEAEIYEYYIYMRAFGKGYEEFYNRIREEGVKIIRGRPAKVEEADGQLLLRSEDILNDTLVEQKFDMVILSVGLEPSEDTGRLSELLGVQTTEDGWFMEANNIFDPVNTYAGGITVAGVCQGPKDIPSTVAQASAAAARVLQNIMKGTVRKNSASLSLAEIEKHVKNLSRKKIVCYERIY